MCVCVCVFCRVSVLTEDSDGGRDNLSPRSASAARTDPRSGVNGRHCCRLPLSHELYEFSHTAGQQRVRQQIAADLGGQMLLDWQLLVWLR